MLILIVNAGSSSLKLRLLDGDDAVVQQADLPADAGGFDAGAVASTVRSWPAPDAVAHRIVHGGTRYDSAVWIDDDVERQLRQLVDLAPLHQPKSLAGLDAVRDAVPDVRAAACFDTAFHTTIPAEAATYAVPAEWRERYGVRRFGFHGLSHAYAARRSGELTAGATRVVTCHLGAGASLCAVLDGRSVDTTMGFTPLEGLVMATRSGDVDPGLLLWLEEHEGLAPHEVAEALEKRSGMLALAGTADMREVETRATDGDDRAREALAVYDHRLAAGVAAMAAAAGGLDAIVFTGGVGERSPRTRAEVAARLQWLGVAIDADSNEAARTDADITQASAAVRTLVVTAREDVQMADEVRHLLSSG